MSEINFQPIFDYIDNSMQVQLQTFRFELKPEFDELKTQIANLATEVKDMRQEMYVSNHRHDRLETWAPKVGDKTSIPFEF